MKVENNRDVYKGKDAFLWLPTNFSKSVRYKVMSFVCLTIIKASWVRTGNYAGVLLVSLLVSLMITKIIGLSEHLFVVPLCSALYATFQYLAIYGSQYFQVVWCPLMYQCIGKACQVQMLICCRAPNSSVALSPGHFQILSRSCFSTAAR